MWRWLARISTFLALGLWAVLLLAGVGIVLFGVVLIYWLGD